MVWNGVLWPVSLHFLPSLLLLIQLVFSCCPTSSEQSFVAGHAESCWPESKLPCEELHLLVLVLSSEQLTVFSFWKLGNHCNALISRGCPKVPEKEAVLFSEKPDTIEGAFLEEGW